MVWDINVKKDRRSSAGKYVWGHARVHRSTDLELYGEGVDLNIGFLNIWCAINILPIIFHAWHSRKSFSLAFSTSRNKLRLNIAYLHRNTRIGRLKKYKNLINESKLVGQHFWLNLNYCLLATSARLADEQQMFEQNRFPRNFFRKRSPQASFHQLVSKTKWNFQSG